MRTHSRIAGTAFPVKALLSTFWKMQNWGLNGSYIAGNTMITIELQKELL